MLSGRYMMIKQSINFLHKLVSRLKTTGLNELLISRPEQRVGPFARGRTKVKFSGILSSWRLFLFHHDSGWEKSSERLCTIQNILTKFRMTS